MDMDMDMDMDMQKLVQKCLDDIRCVLDSVPNCFEFLKTLLVLCDKLEQKYQDFPDPPSLLSQEMIDIEKLLQSFTKWEAKRRETITVLNELAHKMLANEDDKVFLKLVGGGLAAIGTGATLLTGGGAAPLAVGLAGTVIKVSSLWNQNHHERLCDQAKAVLVEDKRVTEGIIKNTDEIKKQFHQIFTYNITVTDRIKSNYTVNEVPHGLQNSIALGTDYMINKGLSKCAMTEATKSATTEATKSATTSVGEVVGTQLAQQNLGVQTAEKISQASTGVQTAEKLSQASTSNIAQNNAALTDGINATGKTAAESGAVTQSAAATESGAAAERGAAVKSTTVAKNGIAPTVTKCVLVASLLWEIHEIIKTSKDISNGPVKAKVTQLKCLVISGLQSELDDFTKLRKTQKSVQVIG